MAHDDLPDHLAQMLRDVSPADERVRDAHIAAALDASIRVGGTVVTRVPFRRAALAAAAAVLMALSAGALGWALRGNDTRLIATAESTMRVVSGVKGNAAAVPAQDADGAAQCNLADLGDAVWLGSYTVDGHTYSLFVNELTVTWYDLSTCTEALTVPHPSTTAP
jgi:hypothetical protein